MIDVSTQEVIIKQLINLQTKALWVYLNQLRKKNLDKSEMLATVICESIAIRNTGKI